MVNKRMLVGLICLLALVVLMYIRLIAGKESGVNKEQTLKVNPRHAEVWYNKGKTLVKLNRRNEAIYAYERFIEFAPTQFAEDIEQVKADIQQLKR